ncbi:Golgi membrane protein 1 [Hoplias malabaricus]|uniref:Golgi membrane protein 1 n=1 Tax=Hoplias malabaricus TaxID=27720 RepID=UPI003461AD68
MMGALVNGRRGGRSPSLLMAALIACVLLLGFNYWVSSSRNVELQAKLLELEEHVRQTSAEREREELGRSEAEKQLRQQAEQINLLKNNHQQQQGNLLLNISSSAKSVQEMKIQMKSLLEELGKVQKDLQFCENNMNTLNKKLTYDMTQCNTQILAAKEECSEKIAAAKQEMQKKYENQISQPSVQLQDTAPSVQKDTVSRPVSELAAGNDLDKSEGKVLNTQPALDLKPKMNDDIKTTEALADNALEKLKSPSISKPSNQNMTLNNLGNEEALEGVMDIKGGDLKAADALLDAAVNKVGKEDEAVEYNNEGEIEERLSQGKDDKADAQEEELQDYIGDDENEPESEAEKQAELAQE